MDIIAGNTHLQNDYVTSLERRIREQVLEVIRLQVQLLKRSSVSWTKEKAEPETLVVAYLNRFVGEHISCGGNRHYMGMIRKATESHWTAEISWKNL